MRVTRSKARFARRKTAARRVKERCTETVLRLRKKLTPPSARRYARVRDGSESERSGKNEAEGRANRDFGA
jgi:hypothetical protein